MNEIEVIKGCLRNDRVSQKILYDAFYSKMLNICLRYAKSNDEAVELLNEGFLKVFTSLHHFNNSGSFDGWVRRIIVNTCLDELRKSKKDYLIVSTVYANEKGETILPEVNDDELEILINEEIILKAVQELTPAYRTVFNLYVIEGFTHKQIAELLDINEGTSKSNLSKAKFILRKNLIHLIKKTNVNSKKQQQT